MKILAVVYLLWAITAHADTLTLTSSKDNTLYEKADGSLSNGSGAYLFAGTTGQNERRRALLRFDLSAIPDSSTINSATLTLTMDRTVSSAVTVGAHRLLADWGEGTSDAGGQEGAGTTAQTGDATWLHTFSLDSSWAVIGGDFLTAASASQSVSGNGTYTWQSAQLKADVQTWLDSSSVNFGWVLIGDESTTRTAKRFLSRENANGNQRPQLTIDFTAPNNAPVVANAIANQSLAHNATLTLLLDSTTPTFSDSDGDALTYSASVGNTAVATVAISSDTLRITADGQNSGTTTVTLIADDNKGGTISINFDVSVSAMITFGDPDPTFLGDFNNDDKIDFDDFFAFADHFGLSSTDANWDAFFDFDQDNDVDFDDFFIFADNFGKRKDPTG